jgi:hypothetical protein
MSRRGGFGWGCAIKQSRTTQQLKEGKTRRECEGSALKEVGSCNGSYFFWVNSWVLVCVRVSCASAIFFGPLSCWPRAEQRESEEPNELQLQSSTEHST